MSISSVTARLAELAMARAKTAEEREALALIAEMPAYVAQKRLDLWEEACNAQRGAMSRAAKEIYAIGHDNMYGAIDAKRAAAFYADALAALRAEGITAELGDVDLTEW